MKELMIDPELRDLLPSLSIDEKRQLEKNLIKNGYTGSPIYTWNGYVVDGHNRYEICKKNDIQFTAEELLLGKDSTKTDVMEWMINTQLGRRNLIPAQRLLVVEKFKERIRKEAKENISNAVSESNKSRSSNLLHSEKDGTRTQIKKIHTDKELAKMAGVGTGTIGRWNQVKKLADEDLIDKVESGEVAIGKAYDIVKEKERQDNKDAEIKSDTTDVFKGDNEIKSELNNKKNEIIEICKEVKSDKDSNTYWNFLEDIECVEDNINQAIDSANSLLFEMEDINGKVTSDEIDIALSCVRTLEEKLNKLYNKIKNVKLKGEM